MKFPITVNGFSFITDDTSAVDANTLFLRTSQNQCYFDAMEQKPESISVDELIELWDIKALKIVGVTGTNGKTTTTAAIYSFLLDLGENPALQGTRGLFAGEERIEEKSMTTPSILETLHNMKQWATAGQESWP